MKKLNTHKHFNIIYVREKSVMKTTNITNIDTENSHSKDNIFLPQKSILLILWNDKRLLGMETEVQKIFVIVFQWEEFSILTGVTMEHSKAHGRWRPLFRRGK